MSVVKPKVLGSGDLFQRKKERRDPDMIYPLLSSPIDTTSEEYELRPHRHRFPLAIVWTSISMVSSIFPFFGHAGIGDLGGKIHDF